MQGKSVVLQLTDKSPINDSNYAKCAEIIVAHSKKNENKGSWFGGLSTSKIRGIYGYITNVYTRINTPEDFDVNISDLQYIKVKMAYESGRDKVVKEFIENTALMNAIDNIETYDQFILY